MTLAHPNLCLIVVSDPPPNLREAIQEFVAQEAGVWWHQMPDVWIVEGDNPLALRDRLLPLKTAAGVNVPILVLQLPDGRRGWATSGVPTEARKWLNSQYTRKADEPDPDATTDDDIPF